MSESLSSKYEASYRGIIDALLEVQGRGGANNENRRVYPANYRGIVDAILDLSISSSGEIGPNPGGWIPGPDGEGGNNGNYPGGNPEEGSLWYDTRQGRLYIWSDDGWYQTNGADGYAYISPTAPTNPVTGQLWVDPNNNYQMWVYDGNTAVNPNRAMIESGVDDGVSAVMAAWSPIGADGTLQNTETLPLANPTSVEATARAIIDFPDAANLLNQADYNSWVFAAFNATDAAIQASGSGNIDSGALPPEDRPPGTNNSNDPGHVVGEGDLWFDTMRLDLNIYYDGYWVSVSGPQDFTNEKVNQLSLDVQSLSQELGEFNVNQHQYEIRLSNEADARRLLNSTLTNRMAQFEGGLNTKVDNDTYTQSVSDILAEISALESQLTNYALNEDYATNTELTQKFNSAQASVNTLQTQLINNYLTTEEVTSNLADLQELLIERIPDVDLKADVTYVDEQIDSLDFLKATDGTIHNFNVVRNSTNKAALDFSGSSLNGYRAFEFVATDSPSTNTFGTTAEPYEMAWEFDSYEDYCWKASGNKVASISEHGVACTNLKLVQFGPNTEYGVQTLNTIDVRQRLENYETAFVQMRSAISTSNDYASLKAGLLTALAGV